MSACYRMITESRKLPNGFSTLSVKPFQPDFFGLNCFGLFGYIDLLGFPSDQITVSLLFVK